MEEIGSILKEAREARGLSYSEVHDALRINPKFLKAMELGQLDALPSVAHARGYLRKYARFLHLESEPLLERYEYFRRHQPAPTPPTAPPPPPAMVLPPEPESGTFFNPLNRELETHPADSRSDRVSWFIILALLVFIALLSWRFLPRLLGQEQSSLTLENLTTAVNEILGREAAEEEAPPVEEDDNGVPEPSSELIVPTGRTTGSTADPIESTTGAEPLPPPLPTRNPLPATIDIINMQIDITERSWLRVIVDEINVFEGQALRGDVLTFTGSDFVNIRTGNAFGVVVRINDIDIGRLGERGQVADQTWETTR